MQKKWLVANRFIFKLSKASDIVMHIYTHTSVIAFPGNRTHELGISTVATNFQFGRSAYIYGIETLYGNANEPVNLISLECNVSHFASAKYINVCSLSLGKGYSDS